MADEVKPLSAEMAKNILTMCPDVPQTRPFFMRREWDGLEAIARGLHVVITAAELEGLRRDAEAWRLQNRSGLRYSMK